MKRPLVKVSTLAITAGLLAGVVIAPFAGASSHREAPLISKDPTADNTDVYAFVSPDKPDTVTLIANYIPFEDPAGGPNFYEFDPSVLYAIHVDNDGDGTSDIDYEFRFETRLRNPDTFLYNTGPITSLDDPDWNLPQFYSVTRVEGRPGRRRGAGDDSDGERGRGGRRHQTLGSDLPTPPVNIGPRSTPDYEALAAAAVR
jgi:hypothetical protein